MTTFSQRTQEQIARKQAQIEAAYVDADLKVQDLQRQIQGLTDNDHRKSTRGDATMTRDLRSYRNRQGQAQVRFLISGVRSKSAQARSKLAATILRAVLNQDLTKVSKSA